VAGESKPTAREAFDDNLADAEALVAIPRALSNRRVRRMRRELRERLGAALDLPVRDFAEVEADLACIASLMEALDRETSR